MASCSAAIANDIELRSGHVSWRSHDNDNHIASLHGSESSSEHLDITIR